MVLHGLAGSMWKRRPPCKQTPFRVKMKRKLWRFTVGQLAIFALMTCLVTMAERAQAEDRGESSKSSSGQISDRNEQSDPSGQINGSILESTVLSNGTKLESTEAIPQLDIMKPENQGTAGGQEEMEQNRQGNQQAKKGAGAKKLKFREYDEVDLAFFKKARKAERRRQNRLNHGRKIGPPKVAFMFLSRGPMPLDSIWERFFKGYEELYSIYIFAPPGFEYNASTTAATTFYGKQIHTNFLVGWASNNVLRAERRLLAAALAEPRNYMFVLLSESCVPLWNITYIHSYLTEARTSFLASIGTDMRWEPQYAPEIPRESWRKGSQWFALLRDHALLVINDTVVFDVIVQRATQLILNENYIQTLVPMYDPDRVENRPVTYVEWRPGNYFHPHTFNPEDIHRAAFTAMRTQSITSPVKFRLYDGWRSQTECTLNGKSTNCFLFARKFGLLTRNHLLHFAETMFSI